MLERDETNEDQSYTRHELDLEQEYWMSFLMLKDMDPEIQEYVSELMKKYPNYDKKQLARVMLRESEYYPKWW